MFDGLVVGNLARLIADSVKLENLAEIRMRVGKRLLLLTTANARIYPRQAGGSYIVTKEDIDGIIARATNLSPYSVSDEMMRGYIPCKNLRIGVGGEGVSEGGRLLNIKNVSYMVIRVPHQIRSAADSIIDRVYCVPRNIECADGEDTAAEKEVRSTLIISPPCGGKTTLLRELARLLSAHKNVVVIDERYELAAVSDGVPTLDVGDADVVSGVPKAVAYENCVRAMNPEVIVTDELFRTADVVAICDVMRSGVKVIATVHGDSVDSLRVSDTYGELIKRFELAVILGKKPVGQIKDVVELWEY
ncbi:MAG: Flp pilus assembly complex ATPase component TadA [Clostridiales bacterium]|nr:Flp pilus assembly complex ATPase component TadA [Clostridiales bacterium]